MCTGLDTVRFCTGILSPLCWCCIASLQLAVAIVVAQCRHHSISLVFPLPMMHVYASLGLLPYVAGWSCMRGHRMQSVHGIGGARSHRCRIVACPFAFLALHALCAALGPLSLLIMLVGGRQWRPWYSGGACIPLSPCSIMAHRMCRLGTMRLCALPGPFIRVWCGGRVHHWWQHWVRLPWWRCCIAAVHCFEPGASHNGAASGSLASGPPWSDCLGPQYDPWNRGESQGASSDRASILHWCVGIIHGVFGPLEWVVGCIFGAPCPLWVLVAHCHCRRHVSVALFGGSSCIWSC